MLFKSCPVKVKAAGSDDGLDEGQFTALVSVFGNVDSYGDVVMPGAFKDSLAEWTLSGNPIPVYYSHRMDDPDYNIGVVLEAKEIDDGLWVRGQLDLDDEAKKARQVYRLMKGRRVVQFSFAYDVLDGGWEVKDEEEFYALRKLRLYEVGPTPLGANQETELLGVKAHADQVTRFAAALKAGRVPHCDQAASDYKALVESVQAAGAALKDSLPDGEGETQDEAKVSGPAADETPDGAQSDEPSRGAPVDRLAAEIQLLEMEGASL